MENQHLTQIGLVLDIVGVLFFWLATKKNGMQYDGKTIEHWSAKIGIFIILLGFVFQLIGTSDVPQGLKTYIFNFCTMLPSLNTETVLWMIFSLLFFVFSIREYSKSRVGLSVRELNLGFSDLNETYNATRDAIIDADKSSHKSASISYFLAFLTAVGRFILA